MTSELELERLGMVSTDVREFVIERDGQCCRMCGRYVPEPALHHVVFRSQGGLDVPSNLVTIGWAPGHDCHLTMAHGPQARLWRPILLDLASGADVGTALAVRRQRAVPT